MSLQDSPLPPVTPPINAGMTLQQIDQTLGRTTTLEDLIEAGIPQQVAQDMIDADATGGAPADVVNALPAEAQVRRAEPNLKPTGAFMGLDFIEQLNNAASDEEFNKMYDALDPALKHVYDRSYGMQVSPQWAADTAQEYYQMQDKQRLQQETPVAKALDEKKLADAQQTMRRADDMIFLMDNLRGGPRDKVAEKSEKWRSRVGSVQGRWPSALSNEETLGWNADFSSLKGMINLKEAQGNKGQGPLSDGERALMAQAASLGLEQARDEPGFEAAFERMYDLALEAKQSAGSKLSGDGGTAPATPATAPGAAASAPAPAPTFQPGKIYRDNEGRQSRFSGYDNTGKPIFQRVQ